MRKSEVAASPGGGAMNPSADCRHLGCAVEESPTSAVSDRAAWKEVQSVIEAVAYGR
jgi:hypothetical protein